MSNINANFEHIFPRKRMTILCAVWWTFTRRALDDDTRVVCPAKREHDLEFEWPVYSRDLGTLKCRYGPACLDST